MVAARNPRCSGTRHVVKRPKSQRGDVLGGASRPVPMEDLELAEQVRQGDVEAFARLVEKYQDRLFNTCWRICGNLEDARDLTQDAFLRAFEKFASFRHQSSVYTWIFRIAVNLALSYRRKQAVRSEVTFDADAHFGAQARGLVQPGTAGSVEDEPDAAVAGREQQRKVTDALRRMDAEQRAVLVLRDIEEMNYEEIGIVLELPVGTVKSRLHRARMTLRDMVSGA